MNWVNRATQQTYQNFEVIIVNDFYKANYEKKKTIIAQMEQLAASESIFFATSYNNFSIEWNMESINWFVNNEQYASVSIIGPEFTEFHKDFFILFNVAVGGKYAGRPDDQLSFLKKCM